MSLAAFGGGVYVIPDAAHREEIGDAHSGLRWVAGDGGCSGGAWLVWCEGWVWKLGRGGRRCFAGEGSECR